MRKEVLFVLGGFGLVLVMLGAGVWLANAPMQPPTEPTRLVLPDARIPR
jgi:hypothetical protein